VFGWQAGVGRSRNSGGESRGAGLVSGAARGRV